jgi:uncharacterized protein (TIGR02246 family)
MPTVIANEQEVRDLYTLLIDAWNARKAGDFAQLLEVDGNVIGFDGSQMNSRADVESTLQQIFKEHQTAPYVYIIEEVRLLTPITGMVRAIAGMVPPGQTELDSALNAIHTVIAVRHNTGWRIALFQNTPAQFHGRPELVQAMTADLRQRLR